ncbi:MAG: 50S ribosomal protein L13 [Nanoarchaeota archaeon]|nr:50S ribosomal protein L13 [Nanoarchaeota archaeon]
MIVIDATNLIIGRLATYAAKQALIGETVRIVNSEKAVVAGKKENVFEEYLHRLERTTIRNGPYTHRMPERLLKRTIRGMIPRKKASGMAAYKRIMCYRGVPDEFKDKKPITIESANVSKLPNHKVVDLLTLSKRLGAKIE